MDYFDENHPLEAIGPETIEVWGARVHNLKNISVAIPRDKLIVLTGLSGSGKSSLAFDTIYAEGQRRYLESFSAYARQFVGDMERPDVDKISGLSPVISIEQKTTGSNPRSTVGTVTDIYDFIRLLFARASDAFSPETGKPMVRFSEEEILEVIAKKFAGKNLALLAPLVRGRKGHYRELFEKYTRQGFSKMQVDGTITEINPRMQLDRYKVHDIDLVVDRIPVNEETENRLKESAKLALRHGNGILLAQDMDSGESAYFSKKLMDPDTGLAIEEPSPNTFSFNSPYGACPKCKGLGVFHEIDLDLVIPDKSKTIMGGGIPALGEYKNNFAFNQVRQISQKYNFHLTMPIANIPQKGLNVLLYGNEEGNEAPEKAKQSSSVKWIYGAMYKGVIGMLREASTESASENLRNWAHSFMSERTCDLCHGYRLSQQALSFQILNKNIGQLAEMDIQTLATWFEQLPDQLSGRQRLIATEVLKEINKRLKFMLDVGMGYVSLNRPAKTLSGGEMQRIRLATQIGSQLVGITYILDEPSIGLHSRDNDRLISALLELRDTGNTVMVVEHDKEIMNRSDFILDLGPGAGIQGGKITAQGTPEEFKQQQSLTADYLAGRRVIAIPEKRRTGNGKFLTLKGATGNNLKSVDLKLPLGCMICVTGVSGSGKSSLINETLYPIIRQHLYQSHGKPLPYKSISGLEHIDKVIEIDQAPIGRTPRSNPATYVGVFTDIRKLFSEIPEAKIRGYKPGRFSFNVNGGRCETCEGGGRMVIEMNFLPDVEVVCESCKGKRYNRETLEVRYKGKSISDVLNMTIENARTFFENIPPIHRKMTALYEVGLGYLTLGQSATTLSGGEAQRVKLSEELSKKDTGSTLYIFDEPTTGLHFEDIRMLLQVLQTLVDRGNTVLIIEHNLDVVKTADYIIDLGPEGGPGGGTILVNGTPEQVAKNTKSHTGRYLKEELQTIAPKKRAKAR